jgi:hypothetical protein
MDLIDFPYPLRFQHLYIPGGTGKGKTTEILNIAVQDILNGCGITVIDPGGDLVNLLLDYIPESRKDHVIYLDTETPIPFDFLAHSGATEKDELIEDIVYLLLGNEHAPRAKSILTDTLYTILTSREPVSFLDITRFLTDDIRRKQILAKLDDQELKDVWKKPIPNDDKLDPILSRFKKYIRNSTLKVVFGTPNPPLKLADVMNNRQILLVNLGGASRAALDYGSLLFMKMKQEVFRRHRIHPSKRIPHFLFVDEFQKFAHVDGFKDVIEMARKYKLAMTLANLSFTELPNDIQAGIEIMQSFICFSLNPRDLSFFKYKYDIQVYDPAKDEWKDGDAKALTKLPDYQAYYKLGSQPGRIKSSPPAPTLPATSFAQYIKAHTLDTYAQSSQKRTGDNDSLHTSTNPHTEGNGNTNTKSEEIKPTGARGDKTL